MVCFDLSRRGPWAEGASSRAPEKMVAHMLSDVMHQANPSLRLRWCAGLILHACPPFRMSYPSLGVRFVTHRPVGAGTATQPRLSVAGWSMQMSNFFKNVWHTPERRMINLHESVRSGGMSAIAGHPRRNGQPGGGGELTFVFPFADGVTNTEFGVFSDYRVMREYLCRSSVNWTGLTTLVNCGGFDVRN